MIGAGQNLQFDRYTMEEGLSHPGTFFRETIIQDQQGFIWISTLNGLNRFDGRTFKTFFFNEGQLKSLASNLLAGIEKANDGKIWVGTSTGISIYDPAKDHFYTLRHDPQNPQSLPSNQINFIRKDQDGHMWIGTQNKGIARYDPASQTFDGFNTNFVEGLVFYQQKDGTIWLGNPQGLHRYLPDKNTFKTIKSPEVLGDSRKQPIADICELNNGNLLITSTLSGLWEFNPSTEIFLDISAEFSSSNLDSPSCILCAQDGTAWLGGLGALYRYYPGLGVQQKYEHDPNDPNSLPMLSIIDMYEDQVGNLWLHIIGEGLRKVHQVDLPYQELGDFQLIEALPWKGQKYLVNTSEGLIFFDALSMNFEPLDIPLEKAIPIREKGLALSMDLNQLFLRSQGADDIYQWDLVREQLKKLPYSGYLHNDFQGRPWIDLRYFDENQKDWIDLAPKLKKSFPKLSEQAFFAKDIYFNDSNTIWVSTAKGIIHYDIVLEKGEHYPLYPNRPEVDVEIYQIFSGTKGRFYCFTSHGLSIFDPKTKGFIHFSEDDGLLHNQTTSMLEDANGDLWIGGPKGLQKIELEKDRFTSYGKGEGLPAGMVLYQAPFRDSLGFLYFSINEQTIRFHPDRLQPVIDTPKVQLLDFYLNHQVVQVDDGSQLLSNTLAYTNQLQLTHRQVDFGFSFVMPVFYKAKEVIYEYQLFPFEKEWQTLISDNQVHYTNMDPGNYTFRVKAQTADGSASPNVATVEVVIAPPWWRTNLAYLTYFCLLLGSIYSGFRLYFQRKLEKLEQQRQKEMADLKSKLYTNITHEFRTPLTVIMGIADNIKGFEQERILIQRNSKNLLRLVNQLLDLAQLDAGQFQLDQIQGDIVHYLRYLTESFYSMANDKELRLTFYPEVKQLVMDYDEVRLQHIVYNLLSNAIKFTDQGGKVILHIDKLIISEKPYLKIKVSDTGKGIPEEDLALIFDRFYQASGTNRSSLDGTGIGLALTKEFVEMMGGQITVSSQINEGTDFLILLPIRQTAPLSNSDQPKEMVSDASPLKQFTNIELAQASIQHGTEVPLVLIIEDNADVIFYIRGFLMQGYRLATATNGAEGIQKALELIPDLIICDVMMPEKDGVEVITRLKQDERTSHIPMILLTAKTAAIDKIKGLEAGADAYLNKPFHQQELLVRLQKMLELRARLQEKYSAGLDTKASSLPGKESAFLQKLQDLVVSRIDDTTLSVKDLERAVNLGNMQLNRKLKALTNRTPSAFIRMVRLQKAQELLLHTDLHVAQVAYEVGFSDPGYFTRIFSKAFGVSPSEFRKK